MFNGNLACGKIDDTITNFFSTIQGVKKGCILSPTLFNIFLADISTIFEGKDSDPVKLVNNKAGWLYGLMTYFYYQNRS